MKQLLITLTILGLIILPYDHQGLLLTNAQTLSSEIIRNNEETMALLESFIAQLDQTGVISLNELDREDWDPASLDQKDLSYYDKKIMTQLLPALVGADGLALRSIVVDRIRRGYTRENGTSWVTAGAENNSQHLFGKAVTLTAIGSTSCTNDVLFPRVLDPEKALWVHYQYQTAQKIEERWPFARAFDTVARQFFWLEARAFTNRPITSLTWSSFLQQIAKGEIEERFGLPAGSLANVAVSELDETVAKARLATALGLPDLPITDNESDFYTAIGRRLFEIELNLPRNSFTGTTRRQIAQQIGFRVLEQQLSLPEDYGNEILVADPNFFTSSPRFLQLQKRLEERGANYVDPRIGFNLPPEEYLSSGSGQTTFQRIVAGDPDAFTIAGSYFLADSLELSPADTKLLVNTTAQATGDLPDLPLTKARPIDPNFPYERLLTGSVEEVPLLFETIGRTLIPNVKAALPSVEGSVLQAISETNKVPEYEAVMDLLLNGSERQTATQKLAISSAADANYFLLEPDGSFQRSDEGLIPGFSIANLRQRGITLLAQAVDLTPADISSLETSETDTEILTETQSIAETVDNAMGWPTGTTRQLTLRGAEDSIEESLLTDQELLQIGAQALWQRLGLDEELQNMLNRYYFTTNLPSSTTTQSDDPENDELLESDDEDTETESEEETTNSEGTGEIIEEIDLASKKLAIPAQDTEVVDSFADLLGVSLEDVELLVSGRMMTALLHITLGQLGEAVTLQTENFTPRAILDAFTSEAPEFTGEQIDRTSSLALVQPSFADAARRATAEDNNYLLWNTFHKEAVYQWNVYCGDKSQEAKTKIAELVDYLVSLPSAEDTEPTPPVRPYQLLLSDTSLLSAETSEKITTAYPDADGEDYRWGVYANPRNRNAIYIGY